MWAIDASYVRVLGHVSSLAPVGNLHMALFQKYFPCTIKFPSEVVRCQLRSGLEPLASLPFAEGPAEQLSPDSYRVVD